MEDLPTLRQGTVTLLFTDIEGSTRLLQRLGDRYVALLSDHHRLLRAAFQEWGGSEIDTAGDAFFVVFPRAGDAVAAALAAQQALAAHSWPEGLALRVRMGLHTGEPLRTETGYVGLDVHRAARLAAAGHGGQVLLSQATYELVRDGPPPGCSLRDLGSHRLKDLQRPEQVFQLLHPDLVAEFPPLKSLDAYPHNLPLQLTRFIGREAEMVEVQRLLGNTRLLTLTGAGGCGKTRLALQVAADLVEEYAQGVWLVELAALSDPALVPQAVATALGVREEPGRPLNDTLTAFLQPKRLLLVLDNCEHLVGACAALADTLLRTCPELRVLATSREVLGVAGETVWRVPSLALPDPQQEPSAERLTQYEAVRLFIDRALLSQPEFAVTNANAPSVAEICQRLEGMPLAIELAAARVRTVPVEQIAARLGDQLGLLTSGGRTAVPRHQTLRATLDWSYGLLPEEEQALLRRVAVFAGGFTVAAAEVVCAGLGLAAEKVFPLLGQLVDKSLAAVETPVMLPAVASGLPDRQSAALASRPAVSQQPAGEVRYRLLETVRQYGAEQLREAGETPVLRGRHREYFLELAEQAEPELEGPHQGEWLERLEREHENLRTALDWCAERGRVEGGRWPGAWAERWWVRGSLRAVLRGWALGDELAAGLRLGGALAPFWLVRGHWSEGRERLKKLLRLAEATPRPALPWRRDRWGLRTTPAAQTTIEIDPRQFRLDSWASWCAVMGVIFLSLVSPSFWVILVMWVVVLATTAITLSLRLWRARRASLHAHALKSAWALSPRWWWRGWQPQKGLPAWFLLLGGVGWLASLPPPPRGGLLEEVVLYCLGSLFLWPVAVLLTELLARLLVYTGARRFGTLAGALSAMGRIALAQNDLPAAWSLVFESTVLYLQLGRINEITSQNDYMASIWLGRGEPRLALYLYELNLVRSLEQGNRHGTAAALQNLGTVALREGKAEPARSFYEDSLKIRRELGDRRGIAGSLHRLGNVARYEGAAAAAGSLYRESLGIRRALGDKRGIAQCLEGLSAAAAAQGQAQEAARLLGAAGALREELGAPLPPVAEREERVAAVRAALGEAAFAAAWTEGRALPLEQSIALALEGG